MDQTTLVYLFNIPAYICALLAIWKKAQKHQWISLLILILLYTAIVVDAYYASLVFNPATYSRYYALCHAHVVTFFVPLVYMFHCPEGGSRIFNPTTIALWLLNLLFYLPNWTWEIVPSYYFANDVLTPIGERGLTIFFKGKFILYIRWAAVILFTQSMVALSSMLKLYKKVTAAGAHYSWKAKAIYFWNLSCGLYLSISFVLPTEMMQTPVGRWTFYVVSALIIGIGSLLIFLGFDLNPIIVRESDSLTLAEFMLDNGELANAVRHIIDDEQIYLEAGVHSDYIINKLGTTRIYFNRIVNALYNSTYEEYISHKRIEHAKDMLDTTDKSLEDIAFASGYSTYTAFYYVFLRETGMTPIAYRGGQNDDTFIPREVEDD